MSRRRLQAQTFVEKESSNEKDDLLATRDCNADRWVRWNNAARAHVATPTGRILLFSIQTSHGNGKMEAYDPQTGEKYFGEYSGSYKGQDVVYGGVGGAGVVLVKPPTGANAFGILIGDKGTTIRLHFEIKPGLQPTGYGIGADQDGNRYEVFF